MGSHRLVAVSSRLRYSHCKRGSSLEVLVRKVVDALKACLLWVCKNHRPDCITDVAHAIGNTEAKAVDRIGVHLQGHIPEWGCRLQPLVELNAVLDPTVVEALRGLIKNKLQNRPARCNLEEP